MNLSPSLSTPLPDHASRDAEQIDLEIDARGLRCPLPILRAKKALAHLQSGQTLRVLTTDPHALRDFQAFCSQTGNPLLAQIEQASHAIHLLSRR